MNKRVLITGGGRGIGAATARHLAGQGYHLCLNYRHDKGCAEALVAEILAHHPVRCIAVQADVGVEAEVVRLFEEMDARLGPVTHLVNNAGRLQPQMRVLEMSAERINQTLTTNVTSCFLCCREAVRRMTAGGRHRQCLLGRRPVGFGGGVRGLCRRQGGRGRADQGVVAGGSGPGDPGQRGASGFYLHRHARRWRRARSGRPDEGADPAATGRSAGRGGCRHRLAAV